MMVLQANSGTREPDVRRSAWCLRRHNDGFSLFWPRGLTTSILLICGNSTAWRSRKPPVSQSAGLDDNDCTTG